MNLGIIGAGEDKFTPKAKMQAKLLIVDIIQLNNDVRYNPYFVIKPTIVSGHSSAGGVDIWAEETAVKLGYPKPRIFAPEVLSWNPVNGYGYMKRNLDIAVVSDDLHVILVDSYPPNYKGRRFPECYHCHKATHVKSGACWTAKVFARLHNKPALFWIVSNK